MAWETAPNIYLPKDVDPPFTAKIKDAAFETEPEYMEGKVWRLFLYLDKPDPADEDQDYCLKVTLGQNWESDDGGQSVYNTQGKTKFNSNSAIGRIIDWVVDNPEALDAMVSRGDPEVAETWKGLKFVWDVKTTTMGRGEDKRKFAYLFPVEFVGAEGEGATSNLTAEELNERLTTLAQEAKNHTAFVREAMKLDAVKQDEELQKQVTSKERYNELKGE